MMFIFTFSSCVILLKFIEYDSFGVMYINVEIANIISLHIFE